MRCRASRLALTGLAFVQGLLDATTQTLAWSAVFFLASAAASSAYLTVSEVFPLEMRAIAISIFYAVGTGIGGFAAPALFGALIESGSRANVFVGYADRRRARDRGGGHRLVLRRGRGAQAARTHCPAAGGAAASGRSRERDSSGWILHPQSLRWREMTRADTPGLMSIAAVAHPSYPENEAVFAERLLLFPAGCRALVGVDGRLHGYVVSHPWRDATPVPLNTLLAALPPQTDHPVPARSRVAADGAWYGCG